jgi:hypothetical protein
MKAPANPFIGMLIAAWVPFALACLVTTFHAWALLIWIPWLGFATAMPLIWHLRNRKR